MYTFNILRTHKTIKLIIIYFANVDPFFLIYIFYIDAICGQRCISTYLHVKRKTRSELKIVILVGSGIITGTTLVGSLIFFR